MLQLDRPEAMKRLRAAGIGHIPVGTVEEMLSDPHAAKLGLSTRTHVACPAHIPGVGGQQQTPAPKLGEHNHQYQL